MCEPLSGVWRWAGTLDHSPFPLLLLEIGLKSIINMTESMQLCVTGTHQLSHWAAHKPQDEATGGLLPSSFCLACDQKLGKNIWVPYKLDHLWIMNFGWQSSRLRVIVLKTVALTSVVMSFPPAPSSMLWFLSLGSCSRILWAELVGSSLASKYLYSLRTSCYHSARPLYPTSPSCTRLKASWRPLLFIFGFPPLDTGLAHNTSVTNSCWTNWIQ